MTDLRAFRDPASVAVVGASDDPAKWGYWLAAGALRGAHRRSVHLVNSRAATVLGRQCVTEVSALRDVPDLVALCVPAAHVDAVVDDALAHGVRGFLGITAGVVDDA
ncbi:MAG: acid--CoA ligase, partial [Mycobacterium sp.]|nr:acid--CoA ligase [Mycobacterium sp.]